MKLFQTRKQFYCSWISTWCFSISLIAGTSSDLTTSKDSDSQYFFYQQNDYPKDCQDVQTQCSSNNASGVYLIKPDGYWEPFEVYCDISANSKGWTVIHRRNDGSIHFSRDWTSYKTGFGFLFREFWLGNEKISYLTNQKKYQLLIDITTTNGSTIRVTYDNFRISDEFSNYTLVSLDEYVGNTDVVEWCPFNVVLGNITNACLRTCENPDECHMIFDGCTCPEGFYMKGSKCIPQEQCGCYIPEGQLVIKEGGFYVDNQCRRKAVCTNGRVLWNDTYTCSSNARCEERDGIRQCYCNEYYTGDGQSCTKIPADCKDIYGNGYNESGIYEIQPPNWPGEAFDVFCNMSDGGGWTVFQRQQYGSVNFFRLWDEYKTGFGNLSTDFWMGNEKLYYLTNQDRYEIRIDLVNLENNAYYGKFNFFRINAESDNYRLSGLGTYSGTVDERSSPDGDFLRNHYNYQFSTRDRDNDVYSGNCAYDYHGGWWYKSCATSNLNGEYNAPVGRSGNIYCHNIPGSNGNLRYTEMKIRPVQ